MRALFFSFFLFLTPVWSLTLSDKIATAQEGDYIVTLMNKTYALITIYEKSDSSIIFQEISVPTSFMQKAPEWNQFMRDNGPKATSWILYEIDTETGKMLECFDVLSGNFIDLSSFDSILSKLMQLPLARVKESDRRRIGASSSFDGFDTRKVWNPQQIFEKQKEKKPQFNVYRATWPKDDSILADKTVELYFDAKRAKFPFPFWMQVKDDSDASFKLPTVDAGHNLPKVIPEMPRRRPYFYDKVELLEDKILVRLSIPPYYKGLKLYFTSHFPPQQSPIEVPVVEAWRDGGYIEYHIPLSFIHEQLNTERPYHLKLTIDSHPEMGVESAKSVRFKKP